MLGLRSVLKYILPELPEWLAAEIARAEHCRREMQCKGSSPRTTPPSPQSSTSMSQDHSTPDIFEKADHIKLVWTITFILYIIQNSFIFYLIPIKALILTIMFSKD